MPKFIADNKILVRYPFEKYYPISSPFGVKRTLDINGEVVSRKHNGIDFACPKWTRILSVADGKIFKIGQQDETNEDIGYGFRIWQEAEISGIKVYIWYGHLAWGTTEPHAEVQIGDPIGMSGNSGAVVRTGPGKGYHLHLGARVKNTGTYLDMEFFSIPGGDNDNEA